MTPSQLAKSNTEDAHQMAVFCWANMAQRYGLTAAMDEKCYKEFGYAEANYTLSNEFSSLVLLYSVPNGGLRDKKTAGKLKATGVKKGIPDINLDHANGGYHGLRIEMKRPKTEKQAEGKLTPEQEVMMSILNASGYLAVSCVGWMEARDTIINYVLGNFDEFKC